MDGILKLLKSSSSEEKIAGVILSVKLLNIKTNGILTSNKEVAHNWRKIVIAAEPIFLIRMLRSVHIHVVAMNLLQSLEVFPKLLTLFSPYMQDIYDTLMEPHAAEVSGVHCTRIILCFQ